MAVLAEATMNSLAAGTVEDLAAGYGVSGWKADDAVIRALSLENKPVDFEAVSTAIRSVYMSWAEESALHLQKVIEKNQYPGGTIESSKAVLYKTGECLLFVDGLRFDLAKRLKEMLERYGFEVSESTKWTALPRRHRHRQAGRNPCQRYDSWLRCQR